MSARAFTHMGKMLDAAYGKNTLLRAWPEDGPQGFDIFVPSDHPEAVRRGDAEQMLSQQAIRSEIERKDVALQMAHALLSGLVMDTERDQTLTDNALTMIALAMCTLPR